MSKLPSYTVSDYIAARLRGLGVDDLFVVPGDFMTNFLNVLVDRHPKLKILPMPNELVAGYAADAYARFRGAGAVSVTYGVGAFSLINTVAAAWVERSPLIFLNGCPSHNDRYYENVRDVLIHHSTGDFASNLEAYSAITCAAVSVGSAAEAPELIDFAIQETLDTKRPCYIEVYKDVWQAACERPKGRLQAKPPESDPYNLAAAVAAIRERMDRGKRPLFWAGIELQRFGLQEVFAKLLDATGLPYMTTLLAKSVLAESNPHFAGVYTGAPAPEPVRALFDGSSPIVGLGTLVTDDYIDLVATRYEEMIVSWDGLVRVGYASYPEVYTHDLVPALLAAVEGPGGKRRQMKKPAPRAAATPPAEGPLTFNSFFDVVRGWIDDTMTVLIDECDSLYVASDLPVTWQDGFLSQAAWGSIGNVSASAIGAGLAGGRRPVVFAGDGGFHMTCQALEPLVQRVPGTIVFVMNNRLYGIEQALISTAAFKTGDFEPYNVFPSWDYAALAKAFGAVAHRVETLDALPGVLAEVKAAKRAVSLVDVVLPQRDLPPEIKALAEEPYPTPPVP